ncbi:hypothetical protein ACM55H_14870 [Flavobacterium sp. ZT3R17]|uniref:hypothetical protein n=1 Tax=Flavobacterium cryoconiti TaxID=3398736 RepID=UPI003A894E19
MKKEWVPIMIRTGKLKMKFMDLLTHYMIVIFLLIPFVLNIYSFIQKHILHNYNGVRSPEEMFKVTLPFAIVAGVFYVIQKNRLKLITIETDLSKDKVEEIIEQIVKELKWYPEIINKEILIFKTYPNWNTGSWGEQITIIFDNSKILVNSICDPEKKASIVSMGRNKENINTLIEKFKTASS